MSKILIVEDDVQLLKAYEMLLTTEGYEVLTAAAGQIGYALAKSEKPDLIILDIMLPGGMNGFDVLEQLKLFEDTKNIPVLVMTNLESEERVAKTIGAVAYLVKVNTSNTQLVEKVKELLTVRASV